MEDGLISEDDFRDFTFTNAAALYAAMNPDFFKGTACESAVDRLLSEGSLSRENGSDCQQSLEHIAD